jgi:TRAP-type C4-dicarboxylate transport system substrate-binding protein
MLFRARGGSYNRGYTNAGHRGCAAACVQLNPERSLHAAALEFARKVKDASQGQIEVRVLPWGKLGFERELLEEPLMGAVDIALITRVVSSNVPIAALTSLTFLTMAIGATRL